MVQDVDHETDAFVLRTGEGKQTVIPRLAAKACEPCSTKAGKLRTDYDTRFAGDYQQSLVLDRYAFVAFTITARVAHEDMNDLYLQMARECLDEEKSAPEKIWYGIPDDTGYDYLCLGIYDKATDSWTWTYFEFGINTGPPGGRASRGFRSDGVWLPSETGWYNGHVYYDNYFEHTVRLQYCDQDYPGTLASFIFFFP